MSDLLMCRDHLRAIPEELRKHPTPRPMTVEAAEFIAFYGIERRLLAMERERVAEARLERMRRQTLTARRRDGAALLVRGLGEP